MWNLVILRLMGAELFVSLPVGPVLRTYMQYSVAFWSLLEIASCVISSRCMWLTIHHKCLQFCEPRLNRSEEIPRKVVGGGIFGRFFNFDKCRLEVAGDVIAGAALVYVGMDVHA